MINGKKKKKEKKREGRPLPPSSNWLKITQLLLEVVFQPPQINVSAQKAAESDPELESRSTSRE